MKIGEASQITIGVQDVQKSSFFWQKLGFKVISENDKPNPWVQLTDGSLLMLLNQDGNQVISLTYFSKAATNKVREMERLGVQFLAKDDEGGVVKNCLFISPDNLAISLVNFDPEQLFKPKGSTLLTIARDNLKDPNQYPGKIGVFGELTHPVSDLEKSLKFWSTLGFSTMTKQTTPYPWAIVSDGLNILGLHQTTAFLTPAISYYAPDMSQRVTQLVEHEGVEELRPFYKVGSPSTIITTPEKQKLFLFTV